MCDEYNPSDSLNTISDTSLLLSEPEIILNCQNSNIEINFTGISDDVIEISDNDVTHVSETQEIQDLDIAKISFSHIAGTFFQYEINSFLI